MRSIELNGIKYHNYTGEGINLIDFDSIGYFPAAIESMDNPLDEWNSVGWNYGKIQVVCYEYLNLPEPKDNTKYIVTKKLFMVLENFRDDICYPAEEVIRDGLFIGYKALRDYL